MMDIVLTQKQGQILSAQMIQSVEILQMPTHTLQEYLQTVVQENPVLELQEYHNAPDKPDELWCRLEWLEATDPQNREYHHQDFETDMDFVSEYETVDDQTESLHDHILAQIETLELPPETAACARFIAGCLDRNGWLNDTIPELAQEFGQSEKHMEHALTAVQSLDPPGVAARNLSECLCLQLMRRIPVDTMAVHIAREHLESLSRNHYGRIAHALNADQSDVRRACDLIRSLEPRPGARFVVQERPSYITPDVIVFRNPGGFELTINNRFLPALNISTYYTRMMKESNDAQVKDYLVAKIGQAKRVIQAVEQRHKTLLACAECILEQQADFFQHNGHLKPLILSDVAKQVGIHTSTVSRAINGKYLQCERGTYPLSHFFSNRLSVSGEGETSSDAAKAHLKELIEQEDKRKPLSDQKLCEHMVAQGFTLARRTVAKYRDELGIPGASGRKRLE